MKKASQSGVLSLNAPKIRGLSLISRTPLQQRLGLFAAVAAEIPMQQVHHGPQMAALLRR